ncbi:MAG: DNA-directed RNA polymerase subunit M [Lachnospiraceae bacterium]|nr:DNA-directed RNA polymerase subunit M [Lachnospiraceae bacterium]
MKIYICSGCGWLRVVSRRKEVECFRCGQEMQQSRLTYEKYTQMSEQERDDYVQRWLLLHPKES